MKKISFLLSVCALFLPACVTPLASNAVRVYDEEAYVRAKNMLQYDLKEQKIDAEILPNQITSAGLNPINTFNGHAVAKKLYDSLDLSFRFGGQEKMFALHGERLLLKDYVTSKARVQMHTYGFTIEQGAERITVTTLGELDWDKDGIIDYIISFRINQNPIEFKPEDEKSRLESSASQIEMPTRDYTLLVRDINAPLYVGEILFIHDYIRQSSGIRSALYRDYETAQEGFFQDHVSTSFEQGEEDIVFAPTTEKKSSQSHNSSNKNSLNSGRANENTVTKLSE